MEVKELVKALLWLAKDTEFVFAADTLRDSASAMESMQEELDRVKAERDAAVENLTGVVNEYRRETSGTDFCGLCEYDLPPAGENGQMAECPGFYRDDCFKWRGLEGRKA